MEARGRSKEEFNTTREQNTTQGKAWQERAKRLDPYGDLRRLRNSNATQEEEKKDVEERQSDRIQ
jgi:hypothetical protein